jgi:hypothetical protein
VTLESSLQSPSTLPPIHLFPTRVEQHEPHTIHYASSTSDPCSPHASARHRLSRSPRLTTRMCSYCPCTAQRVASLVAPQARSIPVCSRLASTLICCTLCRRSRVRVHFDICTSRNLDAVTADTAHGATLIATGTARALSRRSSRRSLGESSSCIPYLRI